MATNILFTRKTLFASLFAIGIAGAAQAQAPNTFNIAGQASGQQVGNIAGGGNGATISGGGDDLSITYSAGGAGGGGAGWGTTGSVARFASTHGDGLLVEYVTLASAPGPGREAWLTGGGDNAEVAYASPHQRR